VIFHDSFLWLRRQEFPIVIKFFLSCVPDEIRVVALFWDRSALIPTNSNFIRDTAEKKLDYYREFLASQPKETVVEDHIDLSGCDQVQYTGVYSLEYADLTSNSTSSSNARFSFTFQTFDGKYWAIKTLHSSKLPNYEHINPLENFNVNGNSQNSTSSVGDSKSK
jgi:hypothetical protein